MNPRERLEDLGERISALLRNSPAADIERNVRAMLMSFFDRLDLVTREDFDVQKDLLARALGRVAELEKRLEELEQNRK